MCAAFVFTTFPSSVCICACFQSASNVCHVYTRQLLHVLSLYLCVSVKRVYKPGRGRFSPGCQLMFWHVELLVIRCVSYYIFWHTYFTCVQIYDTFHTWTEPSLCIFLVSVTHVNTHRYVHSDPYTYTHTPPQLSAWPFLTYPNTSST